MRLQGRDRCQRYKRSSGSVDGGQVHTTRALFATLHGRWRWLCTVCVDVALHIERRKLISSVGLACSLIPLLNDNFAEGAHDVEKAARLSIGLCRVCHDGDSITNALVCCHARSSAIAKARTKDSCSLLYCLVRIARKVSSVLVVAQGILSSKHA